MLKGRVAIVTGAARGIGFEIAKELAARGAEVAVCSRNLQDAKKAARRISRGAEAHRLDVTGRQDVEQFVRRVVADHGRIDMLVNNAGYPFDRRTWYKKFHEMTDEELGRILEVDLQGTVRLTRAVIPVMARRGGVVISISSTPAVAGHVEGAPYTLAKAGIIAMTKHVAMEYGAKRIRAYTLALGNIASAATFGSMTAQERKAAAKENAMKRWGRPSEVARAVAGLAGDDFTFATGNTIVLDGGAVLL